MQFLVSEIASKSRDIYYEGIVGLSTELRSTRTLLKEAKEGTDIIQKQNELTKSELSTANMSLRDANTKLEETLAELGKLKKKLLGKRILSSERYTFLMQRYVAKPLI
jgi:hypothetical protein